MKPHSKGPLCCVNDSGFAVTGLRPKHGTGRPPIQHDLAFGSFHFGGLNMAYGDGRICFVSQFNGLSLWQSRGTKNMSD